MVEKENLVVEMGDLQKQLTEAHNDRKSWRNHCLEAKEKGKKVVEEVTVTKRVVEELRAANAELDRRCC